MQPCTQCPMGRTTHYEPGNGTWQASLAHCLVQPGFGVGAAEHPDAWRMLNGSATAVVSKCPVGSFSNESFDVGPLSANPACQLCPPGSSTSEPGSTSCDGEWRLSGWQTCACKQQAPWN